MGRTTNTILYRIMLCASLLWLSSCGGGADSSSDNEVPTVPGQLPDTNFPVGAEVPDNRYVNSYKILIFGNSHVRSHNFPVLLQNMILAGRPGVTVEMKVAEGGEYLDERLGNTRDLNLLLSRPWTQVILQGQKYSTSGLYSYPTDKSVIWLRAVKAQQATPLLFPEHGQKGNPTEGSRVHLLHQSIVAEEPGCVVPVGLAWDNVMQQEPWVDLHEADGNHAALAGTFLTALVFYQSITGNNAELLPFLPAITLSAHQQQFLRQIAAATLQKTPACPF